MWRKPASSVAVHDTATQPTSVDESLIALQEAVQLYAHDGSSVESLRTPVQLLCVVARRERIPPEKLLVELKHSLAELHEFAVMPPEHRDDFRRRVVDFAIQSYFGVGDST
jgi:hypothetical protein